MNLLLRAQIGAVLAMVESATARFSQAQDGEPTARRGPAGLDVPVDFDRLVHGIYIDPYAPEWFEQVVKAVVARFAPGLGDRIFWSSMKADPLY